MEYIQPLKDFIIDNFLFGERQEIESNVNLFEKGIIDSTGIVELVCYLEETYNFVVEDDDLISGNFSTLNSIADYIKQKKA